MVFSLVGYRLCSLLLNRSYHDRQSTSKNPSCGDGTDIFVSHEQEKYIRLGLVGRGQGEFQS